MDEFPDDFAWVTYDLSKPILDIDPLSGAAEWAREELVIVAACDGAKNGTDLGFALGAIPAATYTDDIAERARSGEFDHLLVECAIS